MGLSSTLYGQNKPLDNWELEVLNKKDLQSETYFSFIKRGEFKTTTISTYLRYGLMKNIELQINWVGTKAENFLGDAISQTASVGLKAFLVDDSKYLPGISLIGTINLTADPKTNPITPSLNILFKKGLFDNFALTGNYKFILDEQEGRLSNNFAVNLDAELTNWWTSYLGVKGVKSYLPINENALYQEYVELGMLFWLADGISIYPYYDFGLGDDSDDIMNIGVLYYFK